MTQRTTITGRTVKFDEFLGLVKGYASVCTEKGEPYFNPQREHFSKDPIFKAAFDFMQNGRLAGDMHAQGADGQPIEAGTGAFAWPTTEDISESFDIEISCTCLMICMPPRADTLETRRSAELTGVSINGSGGLQEEVESA